MTRTAVCLNSAVDTMEMTYMGAPLSSARTAELERNRVEADRRKQRRQPPLVVELAGMPWRVTKGAGDPWRWLYGGRGEAAGIDVTIAPPGAEGGAGVRVELHQEPLYALGAGACVELARRLVEELAMNPETGEVLPDIEQVVLDVERTSRIDLCCDQQGVKLTGFDDELRRWLSPIRKRTRETAPGPGFTGYTLGTGKPLMARAYDKRADIKAKGKEWLIEIWRRVAEYDPQQPVTRIECQSRGPILRQLGYKGWEPNKLADIWAWWYGAPGSLDGVLSMRKRNPQDSDRRRWPLAWWWPSVQNASSLFGGPSAPATRTIRIANDAERQHVRASSYSAKFAANAGVRVEQDDEGRIVDPVGTVGRALRRFEERIDYERFLTKMLEQQKDNDGSLTEEVAKADALLSSLMRCKREGLPVKETVGFRAEDAFCPALSFLPLTTI